MIVLTEHPLKAVLRSADFSGRISKLGAYDIRYQPKTSIKGQVLADFIVEKTGPLMVNHVSTIQQTEGWKLYIDGASNSRGSGLGIVLSTP